MNEAADFKSAVSTYFTIQAQGIETGGAARSRTGLAGFAIRYITALLPRRILNKARLYHAYVLKKFPLNTFKRTNEKGQHFEVLPFKLEREKSLELSTSTLARLRSTN